jgi:hypothetical protein
MKEIYQALLKNIPDDKVFPTVDEMDASSFALAKKYPDIVEIFEMGKTREGHPLLCLKIGNGASNALMFGLPHPNEPIGVMLMEYFTRSLAESAELREELGFTWYIIKAWDADGAKLNEGWFKGPFSISNYVRNFYRPAGYEQVDWTFAIDHKELHFHDTLPESDAMKKLIDDIQPRFIYSLHNAGFGGVYWYATRELPGLYEQLYAVPPKYHVPINRGEPETPSCVPFAPSVYEGLGIAAEYDYVEKYGNVDMKEFVKALRVGDCSASYAKQKYNSFTFLTELPYFYDPRIEDESESDITRKEAILQKTEDHLQATEELLGVLDISKSLLAPENHFLRAIGAFTGTSEEDANTLKNLIESDPVYEKLATQAEKFDNLLISKFYQSLCAGLLVRANESELELLKKSGGDSEKEAVLTKATQESLALLKRSTDFLEEQLNYTVVPIKDLVGVQLECGLLVIEYLKEHPEA